MCFRFGDPSLSGATLKRLHVHLIKPKQESKARFPIGGHQTLKKEYSYSFIASESLSALRKKSLRYN